MGTRSVRGGPRVQCIAARSVNVSQKLRELVMTVPQNDVFADAITCGDVAAVLCHSTFSRVGITPISIHGGVS